MAMVKEVFRKLTLKLAILLFCTNLGIFIYQTTEQRISIARMNVHLSAGTKFSEVSGIEIVTFVRADSPVTEIIPNVKTDSPVTEIVPRVKTDSPDTEIILDVKTDSPDTEIIPDVKADSPDTEIIPDVKTDSPNTEIIPTVKTDSPDTEIIPNVKTDSPVTEIVPRVKTDSPDTEIILDVKTDSPDTEIIPDVKADSPDTEIIPDVKTDSPNTEIIPTVKTDSPDTEIIPDVKTDSPDTEIIPTEKAETKPIDTFPAVRVEDVGTYIFPADKQQFESEGKKKLTNFTRLKEAAQSVKTVQLSSSFGNTRSSLEHSNKRVTTQPPILVLFTTWVSRDYKRQIHDNVLRTWRLNHPFIVPMLFSQEPNERNRARSYGWWGLSLPETACGGVPILREMFRVALKMYPFALLYGFSNGDLLLGSGLLDTVRDLAGERFLSERPVLLILRRFNLDFTNRSDVHDLRNVEEMRAQAIEVTDGSSDAFFTNHLFPWHYIPNIVPGRLGVAMWLVAAARSLNITVIDITPTVTAVHMTSQAGNLEAHRHAQKMCNRKLLNVLKVEPPSWKCGSILCAPWISVPPLSESNKIRVLPKQVANISTSSSCDNCTIHLKSLYR